MLSPELDRAVREFTTVVLPLTEKDLERAWTWKDHDREGIRFAFFVTLQELRQLAVILSSLRAGRTQAQHILGQYHAAYRDLQAAVLGLSNEDAERAPAEGEWSDGKPTHIFSGRTWASPPSCGTPWKATGPVTGRPAGSPRKSMRACMGLAIRNMMR